MRKLLDHLPQPTAERLGRQDAIQSLERDARVKLLSSHLREQLKTSSGRARVGRPSMGRYRAHEMPTSALWRNSFDLVTSIYELGRQKTLNEMKQQLPNKKHLEAPEELKRVFNRL